jgi:hypothetical protein
MEVTGIEIHTSWGQIFSHAWCSGYRPEITLGPKISWSKSLPYKVKRRFVQWLRSDINYRESEKPYLHVRLYFYIVKNA